MLDTEAIIRSFEKVVTIYKITWRHNLKDHNRYQNKFYKKK